MAELIPDWTALGNPMGGVPTPNFRRITPDNSGRIMEAGMETAAANLGQISNEEYQAQQQAKAQAINLARAKSVNAALDHETAVTGLKEQITQDVASGKLPYDQARQTYNEQVAKIPPPQIANLDPVGQENMQRQLARTVATAGFQIDGTVALARRQDFQDQFAQNLDKLGKLAGMPGADIQDINDKADAFRPLAREAGLPATFIDESLNKFKEQNWFNDAAQRSMVSKDNPQALKLLQHDLVDPDGLYADKLNTARRNEVLHSVIDDQNALERRAELEQEKRETRAQMALRGMDEQISSGVPATAAMWSNWDALTKGTQAEGAFRQAQADETTVQAMLRQPPEEQQRFIQEKQQQLDTEGGTVRDQNDIRRLKAAFENNINLMEKTPLLFSAIRHGTDPAPLPLQDLSKPEAQQQIAAQVSDRMAELGALRKQYGPQIGLKPLLPQEVDQIGSQLRASPPAQQAATLDGLRSSFKDDVAYRAALEQVAPHDPVVAIAGEIGARATPQTRPVWFDRSDFPVPGNVQATILAGHAALNPPADQKTGEKKDGFPMPTDGDLRAQWAKASGDIFRNAPLQEVAYYDAFRSYYAGVASSKGDYSGGGPAKLPDKDLVSQAAAAVLGKVVSYNGASVAIPYGMSESKFRDYVPEAIRDRMAAAGYGDGEQKETIGNFFVHGAQLTSIGLPGSGRYYITQGNHDLVNPKTGQKIIVDLYDQYDTSHMGSGPPTRGHPSPAVTGGATPAQQSVIDAQVQQDSTH